MCATLLDPNRNLKVSPTHYFMQISGFWRRQLCPWITQWTIQGEVSVTQMSPEETSGKRVG